MFVERSCEFRLQLQDITRHRLTMSAELVEELKKFLDLSTEMENKITAERLTMGNIIMVSESDLKDLGFPLGDRKLMVSWINGRIAQPNTVSSALPSSLVNVPSAATVPAASTSVPAAPTSVNLPGPASVEDTLIKYTKAKQSINGKALVEKLKAGIYYSPAERIFMVKVLGRNLMKTCTVQDRPSSCEKVGLAKRIVEAFPILKDNSTPNGYEGFYDKVTHTGYLESYIRNKRSRDPEITTLWKHKERSVLVVAEPSDNERILRERRPNASNTDELLALMEVTRPDRREWIESKQPTITEVLKRYPRFQDINAALLAEYKAVIPEEAREQQLRTEWHKVRDAVLQYAKVAKSTTALSELLSKLDDEFNEDQLTEVSFRVLPHLLTVPPQRGKKNPKLDGSAIEKMFFFDVQAKLWLKVDKAAIEITNPSCFADAVELLMACFWAFNVEYCYHLKPMYEVIEVILKIVKSPRSTCAREFLRYIRGQ